MRKKESVGVVRIPGGNVTIGIDDTMEMENMVCCDEIFEGRSVF